MQNRRNKLNNPKSFNSLWDYIKLFIRDNSIDTDSISQYCKIEATLFSQLLDNKIRVVDFGPKKIAQLVKYLNLKIEVVRDLLIKTIWLNEQNITIKEAMARYDPNKGLDHKDASMSSGLKELLFKANKVKPLEQLNPNTEQITNNFLIEFDKYYRNS